MSKMPKVAIVILNWNGLDDTLECLCSLRAIDYPNYEVIIVDNASEDGDVKVIEAKHGHWIHVIKNKRNLGFAEGNNIGIRYALKQDADYVLLLNNDTTVSPSFLNKMVDAARSDDEIAILIPTIYDYDVPDTIQSQMRKIGWYGPPGATIRLQNSKRLVDVEIALGTCMLIKRETVERIGLLSSDYFLQVEDTDYSVRTQRQGFRIVCVPQATIWHKGSASLNKVPAEKLGYFTRNRFLLRAKYATNLQLATFVAWALLVEAPINLIYYLLRFRDLGTAKGLLWGAREGVSYLMAHRIKRNGATP